MVDDGWSVVHLHRRGLADQVLSECLADARGVYHKTGERPGHICMHIDPAELLERYDRPVQFAAEEFTALTGVPHRSLTYETHQTTAYRICTALRLLARTVCTDLRRLGGSDPRDRLENYDEIEVAQAAQGIVPARTALPVIGSA